jgi:hypothetical protein
VRPVSALDPQDVGVGVCPGHWWCQCRAGDQSTCGSSARVQSVWSQMVPNGLFRRLPCLPFLPTAQLVVPPGVNYDWRTSRATHSALDAGDTTWTITQTHEGVATPAVDPPAPTATPRSTSSLLADFEF